MMRRLHILNESDDEQEYCNNIFCIFLFYFFRYSVPNFRDRVGSLVPDWAAGTLPDTACALVNHGLG